MVSESILVLNSPDSALMSTSASPRSAFTEVNFSGHNLGSMMAIVSTIVMSNESLKQLYEPFLFYHLKYVQMKHECLKYTKQTFLITATERSREPKYWDGGERRSPEPFVRDDVRRTDGPVEPSKDYLISVSMSIFPADARLALRSRCSMMGFVNYHCLELRWLILVQSTCAHAMKCLPRCNSAGNYNERSKLQ